MKVKIYFPEEYADNTKVPVIKAVRVLTGYGLYDAKRITEIQGECIIDVPDLNLGSPRKSEMESQLNELVRCGVSVSYYGLLLDSLRKAASDAVLMQEDDIADNILQHILALKLKYGL